ncbi:MAG: pyridoxamine kinase [Sarcina ventriculi]|uniref:pyridoxal kinase n=1 Tax=Sarcina ventriculi TaxID=1267 RepID=A0ABP2AVB5_SARVE|nr:pyridoxamine kinase [Sarcina ventriculi]MDO4401320.1 pyridoxamine kinase [Clostridiaceae bacterium]MBU5323470.1 pyridoxamine kinase [Sarcina ventriculi]MCI5637207.1 pyridoxamine kinase [Sarcina ventriculi]MDD7372319.1 pyridoxamine kinase [Sarcina ventriculi]MDY7061419.1 pyridoxamine kinase [Sarcina ventriculi]
MNYIKRIAAIHDMSCFGKASLTTIIPILSVMGNEVCPMPTAILSTHTGGFGKPAFVDLSGFMEEAKKHWESLGVNFQCIYSGYLGNSNQVDFVIDFIRSFKKNDTLVVVDPVMGDNGKLYTGIDTKMVESMKKLIAFSDIITPNITEACFLLGKEYKEFFTNEEVEEYAIELSKLGIKKVIITSVVNEYNKEYINTIAYDKEERKIIKIKNKRINASYSGTGDAFTSIVIGSMMQNKSFEESVKKACDFLQKVIKNSSKLNYPKNQGIILEKFLKDI